MYGILRIWKEVVVAYFEVLSRHLPIYGYIFQVLFPSGIPTKPFYAFLPCPINAECPTYHTLPNMTTRRLCLVSANYENPYYATLSSLL